MENGQVSSEDAEKFRQEGREEVLDWLVSRGVVNYSSYDNEYFKYSWKEEILTVFPWRKVQLDNKTSPDKAEGNE